MILVGYLVEGAILFCWYKFILCKELHQKHILKRSIKILKCNMKVILKIYFFFMRQIENNKMILSI